MVFPKPVFFLVVFPQSVFHLQSVHEPFLSYTEIYNVSYQLKIALACSCVFPSWLTGCTVAKSILVIIALQLFTLEGDILQENMCFYTSWVICLFGELILIAAVAKLNKSFSLKKPFISAKSEIDWEYQSLVSVSSTVTLLSVSF